MMNAPKLLLHSSRRFVPVALLGMAVMLAVAPGAQAGFIGNVTITLTSDGDPSTAISDTLTIVDTAGNNVVPPLIVTEADEVGGVAFVTTIQDNAWNLPNTLIIYEPSGAVSDELTLLNIDTPGVGLGFAAQIWFTSDDDNGNIGTIPIITPQFSFTEGANGITRRRTIHARVGGP